ncbi:ATP-binding protein [Gorillibacterium timonense]|uniref:ATP-binding protein n=1 Tax=Gorillibacterium timonense TaxID=1689269 RepID=UPI00071E17E5|nr:ATP-binding protein [Gorillibacterium timonense]
MREVMIEDLVYLETFPVIAAVVHHFYNRCLGCRMRKPIYILLLYALYCAISGGLYFAPLPGSVTLLLNVMLLVLLTCFYKKRIPWRIGAAAFIGAMILLSDFLAQILLMTLFDKNSTALYVLSLFISKVILMTLGYAAVRIGTSYGEGVMSAGYWALLILSPLLSLVSIYGLSRSVEPGRMDIYLSLSVGLVFLNYFVVMICDHVLYKHSKEKQTLLLEQQIDYYARQYKQAEAAQRETLRFRHDFKNILTGLQAELEAGNVSVGQETVETLLSSFSSTRSIAHSGHIAIDSILNYKLQLAAEANIPIELDLRCPADVMLDPITVSVILGNALDNAIEACKRMDTGRPCLTIQIHYDKESLFLRMENPYSGTIRTDLTGRVRSTKSGPSAHGIGLESIRDMVEKNHGLLDISYEGGVFQLEVVLFNVQRSAK